MRILSLLLLLGLTPPSPPTFNEVEVRKEGEGAVVSILLGAAPTFTTKTQAGVFLLDVLGAEVAHPKRLAPDVPGIRSLSMEAWSQGGRLRIELEPWAEADPRVVGRALEVHVMPRPEELLGRRALAAADRRAADEMTAALDGLAEKVAAIGGEMVALREAAEGERESRFVADLKVQPAPSTESLEAADSRPGHGAGPAGTRGDLAVQPGKVAAVIPASPASSAEGMGGNEVVAAVPPAAPASAGTERRGFGGKAGKEELLQLAFKPTEAGAAITLRFTGEVSHNLMEREGMLVVELPGTRIRRQNDRRPFDASFFDTAVGLIRPVEVPGQALTRIEIQLRRKASFAVEQGEDQLLIEIF